jgi:predicted HicB family RNase H-like nuclease
MPRRTSSEKRIATAVRLPEDLHDELQRQADRRDVSVNFLVVRAVQRYLESAPDPTALETAAPRSA